ncbi:MAG: sigma-70 family RNA polymerase sigma factor [Chloroflexi bacterium]|nr:sigma-70 family RNA polymerase sigma factor [Chloroflexota bacterium]
MVRETPPAERALGFRELYDRHSGEVYVAALRVTGNPADAEDVLQSVFLRVFDGKTRLDATWAPGAYLRRAAVNASIDLLRRKKSRPETGLDERRHGEAGADPAVGEVRHHVEHDAATSEPPEEARQRQQVERRLAGRLSERQRDVERDVRRGPRRAWVLRRRRCWPAVRHESHVLRPAPEEGRGRRHGHDPDQDAHAEGRRPPPGRGDEELHEERYDGRPNGEAEVAKRERASPPDDEPVRDDDGGGHRHDAGVHAARDHLDDVVVPELLHGRHEDEGEAQDPEGANERPPGAEAVDHGAGEQRRDAAQQPAEHDRGGEGGAGPPELRRDRLEEDAEHGEGLGARAESAEGHDHDHHPAVEEPGRTLRLFGCGQTVIRWGGGGAAR